MVATRSHTLTGSVCSRAKQVICGKISPRPIIHSKAYRITTPFWAESGKGGWGERGGLFLLSSRTVR